MDISALVNAGIDYDKGIERFLGDTELYETVLDLFMQDESMNKAKLAMADGNYAELFDCVHTIKGTSGNMDMKRLYMASCALTELLRNDKDPDRDVLSKLFAEFEDSYICAKRGIVKAKGLDS